MRACPTQTQRLLLQVLPHRSFLPTSPSPIEVLEDHQRTENDHRREYFLERNETARRMASGRFGSRLRRWSSHQLVLKSIARGSATRGDTQLAVDGTQVRVNGMQAQH